MSTFYMSTKIFLQKIKKGLDNLHFLDYNILYEFGVRSLNCAQMLRKGGKANETGP